MKKNNLKKIVFLCSGGGGNLVFIINAICKGWIKGDVVAIFTDRKCQANVIAKDAGIKNKVINFKDFNQKELQEELFEIKPDLIVTTVHRILCAEIVEAYRGKLINLHYSLLPAFGGLIGAQPVSAAIDYGAKFAGVTVHLVDESVDGGRPLIQAVIPIQGNDLDLLMNIIFRCGCLSLLGGINACLDKQGDSIKFTQIKLMERLCMISCLDFEHTEFSSEEFWKLISSQAKIKK